MNVKALFGKNKSKSSSSSLSSAADASLRAQFPTPADVPTKIRISMLAAAVIDALGAPAEYQQRFSFPFITSMRPNNNFKGLSLAPGVWTDDTSMTLCLAQSLSTVKENHVRGDKTIQTTGGFDEVDQLRRYKQWFEKGYFSSIGKCFCIDDQTKAAIQIFNHYGADPEGALHRIRSDLGGADKADNGSLARVLPIGLAYWSDESEARMYAKRSSQATHPSQVCLDACEVWAGSIALIMQHSTQPRRDSYESGEDRFSKLSLLEYISSYPFTSNQLLEALTPPPRAPSRPEGRAEREQWYFENHPLLRLIARTQTAAAIAARPEPSFPYNIPTVELLPSTNLVNHSIVAALYCFFATRNFEDGAIMAVNLGHDADTVGTIYAGLAACWYAAEEGKAEKIFWTNRVRSCLNTIVKRSLIEDVSKNLISWERKMSAP